ncbi:MAG: hypothetical protein H7Y09_00685 [Chitinophagaceae bacterium]|nr:hypothetical protein [Anaerolineae bacterium]
MTPRLMRLVMMVVCVLMLASAVFPISAQNDGQLCVETFEDRNGNGAQDGGEPLLTRGVSANLLDVTGVIIESQLLDSSPRAGVGLICFSALTAGQYSLEISSADYQATIPGGLTVEIISGQPPQVLTFGGRRIESETGSLIDEITGRYEEDALVERALVAAAGSAVAMLLTAFIGFIIYALTLRGRYRRVPPPPPADDYYRKRTTTGSMRAVRPSDTGEYPRNRP